MSEQLLPQQIRLSLNDASGTPLPGGSVTFFETGTTDLADIWADAAASVPLANPVVADAAGRIVQVFFTAGYGVKAVIKTAAGVTVDTLDPCPRFSGTASAASQVGFAPITGNAATNVQTAIANNTAETVAVRPVETGGTGGTSPAAARENLGAAAIDSPTFTGTPTAPTAAAGTDTTQLATTAFVGTAVGAAMTKAYASTGQTITSAGALTLAHGLGEIPKSIQLYLKCLTAEFNYSVGDEVFVDTVPKSGDTSGSNLQGVSIVPDATNLNIRYGSATSAYIIANKTTGAACFITNASWQLYVRAFA